MNGYSFVKVKKVQDRRRLNSNSIQYIKEVAQSRGDILNSRNHSEGQDLNSLKPLDFQLDRDLTFLVKRCFEERIEKSLHEELIKTS